MKKIDNLSFDELESVLIELGEQKFKAKKIFDWINDKLKDDFEGLLNV